MTANTADYNFITDRLAIGNVASRAVPGFCAVVSVLTVRGTFREFGEVELANTMPQVPDGSTPDIIGPDWFRSYDANRRGTPVIVFNLADGEDLDSEYSEYSMSFCFDALTTFIAEHIKRGCVLVHCGAGLSRSAAVVIAYLCRYAGMSYSEALSFVKARRPSVAPADCFKAAIERWLSLRALAEKGPRVALEAQR